MSERESEGASERLRRRFEECLEEIGRVVSWITCRMCLSADEAEEFRSWVHLKLIEDDYRVLRRFGGRSELATYLTTVVQNLARDFRTRRWGRWRPSAAAERLGVTAIQLESLLFRDGFSLDEATEILRSNFAVRLGAVEIAGLAAKLPSRTPVRIGGDERLGAAAARSSADQAARDSDHQRTLDRVRAALARSLERLEVEDRLLLKMHYRSGLAISAIAAALGREQRRLYTRRDRCLRQLRRALEGEGLGAAEVLEALARLQGELELDYGVDDAELGKEEPSNRMEDRPEGFE